MKPIKPKFYALFGLSSTEQKAVEEYDKQLKIYNNDQARSQNNSL